MRTGNTVIASAVEAAGPAPHPGASPDPCERIITNHSGNGPAAMGAEAPAEIPVRDKDTTLGGAPTTADAGNEEAAAARLLAKRSFPLVPKHNLNLVSLTGRDYPNLRAAFGEAWERTMPQDRKRLLTHWRKNPAPCHITHSPFIAALPHWPCREPDEFGMTHPSGHAISFIAPLIEIMPSELAIGVVARELAYAHCFRGTDTSWGGLWAVRPRRTWNADFTFVVSTFEGMVGCKDLSQQLADWMQGNTAFHELSQELEAEAFMYQMNIGQFAARIYS